MLAPFPAPMRPVMVLAAQPTAALATKTLCTCPVVHVLPLSEMQLLIDNGVVPAVAIWAMIVYGIFKEV